MGIMGPGQGRPGIEPPSLALSCSKTLQRNRKMAMGRKKFNMDPKKVLGSQGWDRPGRHPDRGFWHFQVLDLLEVDTCGSNSGIQILAVHLFSEH